METKGIDLGSAYGWLIDATRARLIDWKPTAEPAIERRGQTPMRGYEARIGDLRVKTIVRSKEACAIQITKGDQVMTITDNPKVIPGDFRALVCLLCGMIHDEIEKGDVMSSLESELGRILFSRR